MDLQVDWIWNLIRKLCIFLDYLIYRIIEELFSIMFMIAQFDMIELYEEFESRIYIILGIFMLFKVVVSMLSYLVNPDKITDNQNGISKVVTRIIVSLVMLIMLPTFFDLTVEFQDKFLPVLPRIIIGEKAPENSGTGARAVGQQMSMSLMKGFVVPNCGGELNSMSQYVELINDKCPGTSNVYRFKYLPLVSTIVGLIMIYVAASLCISAAIRAFKLLILRAMAPIPVISYIDPKSSKDGMFSHWIKTFAEVWAELFINLGMIYLLVYLIQYIFSGAFHINVSGFAGIIYLAFIVIGLFMFAKKAPEFIFSALGIKNKGNFTRMLGMGATALGGLGSTVGSFRARNRADIESGRAPHLLGNLGKSLFNGAGSLMEGGNALLGDKAGLGAGIDAQKKYNSVNMGRINTGSTVIGRALAGAQTIMGLDTDFDKMDTKVQDYESATSAWKRIDSAMNSDNNKFYNFSSDLLGKDLLASTGEQLIDCSRDYSSKEMTDLLDRMKSSGRYTQAEIDKVDGLKKNLQEARWNDIRSQGASGVALTGTAAQIYSATETIYKVGKKYANDKDSVFAAYGSATSIADSSLSMGKDFKGASYNASRSAEQVKNSPEYVRAKANKNEAQKKS